MASPDHRIIVHLGSPLHVTRKIGGRVERKYVTKGAVTVIPAGQATEWQFEVREAHEALLMYVSPTFVRQVAVEADLDADKVEVVNALGVHDTRIEQIGLALLQELLEKVNLAGKLYAETLAKVLALELLRRYSTLGEELGESFGGLTPQKLKQATEYINDNLAGELSLAVIAEATGISAYHLAHLFKQSTGLAPHQYVIKMRVEEAKRLLAETNLTVGEIAQRVGYTHSRFSALFHRHVGISPTAYRGAQKLSQERDGHETPHGKFAAAGS